MDETTEKTTETTQDVENPEPRENKRIKTLSEKVETTAKERDSFKTEAETAKREAAFYKDFSGLVSKNPTAADFQDKIKEKVMAGYTPQDAMFAVLGSEGKLPAQPVRPVEIPAGGSAINPSPSPKKSVGEMTQAERLEALREAERRGDIYLS